MMQRRTLPAVAVAAGILHSDLCTCQEWVIRGVTVGRSRSLRYVTTNTLLGPH